MKSITRLILNFVTLMLIAVGAPAYLGAAEATSEEEVAPSPFEVVQIWACEMTAGTTEVQVEGIAQDWLKAIRQLPGGTAIKMKVFFPVVINKAREDLDFYFVMNTPTFQDWGKIWDAFERRLLGCEGGGSEPEQGRVSQQHAVGSARRRSEISFFFFALSCEVRRGLRFPLLTGTRARFAPRRRVGLPPRGIILMSPVWSRNAWDLSRE